MNPKTLASGASGGLAVVSFLASVFRWILFLIGLPDTAKRVEKVVALSDGLNWDGIYFIVFGVSAGIFIALNIDWIGRFWAAIQRRNKRNWNAPGIEALDHILYSSAYGISIGDRKDQNKLLMAMNVFLEAAKDGRIHVSGIPVGENLHTEISPRALKNLKPSWGESSLDLLTADGTVAYYSLITEKEPLYRVWPITSIKRGERI